MAGYKGGTPYRGVAPALNTLLNQLNAMAPKRSKASDGALGNAAHAATVSFHNPNPAGIVQARDFTDDVANGLDCKWLAKALTQSGDPRILEIISNRRYWTPQGGWVPYYGSNPHDKHLHLSVRSEPALYNSTAPWDLSRAGSPSPTEPDQGDDMYGTNERNELVGRIDEMRGELDVLLPEVVELKDGVGRLLDAAGATRAMVANLFARPGADVDENALANALVPLLAPALSAKTGASKAEVEAVIRSVLGGLNDPIS